MVDAAFLPAPAVAMMGVESEQEGNYVLCSRGVGVLQLWRGSRMRRVRVGDGSLDGWRDGWMRIVLQRASRRPSLARVWWRMFLAGRVARSQRAASNFWGSSQAFASHPPPPPPPDRAIRRLSRISSDNTLCSRKHNQAHTNATERWCRRSPASEPSVTASE